jgi:hypothetical protein
MKKPQIDSAVFLCPRKDGMPEMQEHIFGDVHGRTVCRKCRVIAVFRNANSLAFRRYHAIACSEGRSIFSAMSMAVLKKIKLKLKFIRRRQCSGCANNATLFETSTAFHDNKGDKDAY